MALARAGEMQTLPSYLDMFLGLRGGCLGETCAFALIIGGIYLIARKVITPTIPLAFIGGVAVLAVLLGEDPLMHIMGGGCLIGAIFMATDYTTSPVTEKGKVIFGLGCAVLTMLIRVFGSYPEGVSYAILLMNIVCPHINRMTRSKPFGGVQ
jgi:electron transport complex protein RnfD